MGGARGDSGLIVVGAGRLASALVPAFVPTGVAVRLIVARRLAAARRLARIAGHAAATTSLERAALNRGPIILAVSDRAIAELAASLAAVPGARWDDRVVLHCAGALGPEALQPLATAGASVGVLHPLQCLGATTNGARLLVGARARIEGHPRACAYARRLARAVGLVALADRPWNANRRAAYHAAAALASNDVVALLADAFELLERAGFERTEALEALLPLTNGTVGVIAESGIAGALTGPAARGDEATLRKHYAQLAELSPDTVVAHRRLSRRLRARAERDPDRS